MRIDHASVYFLHVTRVVRSLVLLLGGLAGLACLPPPSSAPSLVPEPGSEDSSEPDPRQPDALHRAIEIAGLPASPSDWPEPVPTIWPDGALSIRALRLDTKVLLAAAEAGEIVRVSAFVQGDEPRNAEAQRTWLVDRTLDLDRLDQGIAVEPPLAHNRPGSRVEVVGRLEQRDRRLVLSLIAWTELGSAAWNQAEGAPSREQWPPETQPSALLRRAVDERPLDLADDLEGALDRISSAALADDGALAERHARRAIELDPTSVEAWSTLIALYHGYAHYDHQLAAMEAARARGLSELDGLWLDYGSLDVELGEFGHALPLLERAIAITPESLAANFYLATAHWLLGDREAARPGYAKVVELDRGPHEAVEQRMIATAKTRLAELGGPQRPRQ